MPLSTQDNIITQLENYGLEPKLPLELGTIQRVDHTTDKRGGKSGFYIVWEISPNKYAGTYGCFKISDEKHKFSGDAPTENGYKNIPMKLPELEFVPDFSMWENSNPCKTHPYLDKKGVQPFGDVRRYGDHLLLQVMDGPHMVGLQTISKDGQKKFVKGSKFNGSHFTIKGDKTHAFAEGYATACSIHEVTGWTVHVCFSCHNMPKVARKYVGELAVVCADNDDAGLRSAKKSAEILCCSHYVPPTKGNDWNDEGAEMLSGIEGKNFNSLPVKDPHLFLKQWAPYLKTLPKSQQLMQAERFRSDYSITKELFKSFVSEAVVEEDGEERAEAMAQLWQYYVCEDKLYRVDVSGLGYWRVSRDEVKPLIEVLSGEDGLQRAKLWQDLTQNRRIDRFEANVVLEGASGIELTKNETGATVLCSNISLKEVLLSAKRKVGGMQVPLHIQDIFKGYHEVIDCFKACLYRKVLGSTKSTIYFRTCSDYGKTFFFDVEGLSLSIRNDYDNTDFSGVDSQHLARYMFLFIDEATKFSATMKKDVIGYDRKYGGYQTLRLPMRIMACANEVPDIEDGADEQILKRVTTIHPQERKLDDVLGKVDHTLHKKMWDSYIIDVLLEELKKADQFSKMFDSFLGKHRGKIEHKPLHDMVVDAIWECHEDIRSNSAPRMATMEVNRHILETDDGLAITSPSRTIREVLNVYRPNRLKAFRTKYSNILRLADDLGTPFVNQIGGRRTKSILIPYRPEVNEDGA